MWGLPLGLGQCSPAGRATPGAEGSRRVRRWRDQGLVGTGTLTAPVFTAAPPRGPKSHDWPSLELKAVLILESRAVKGRFWSLTAWVTVRTCSLGASYTLCLSFLVSQ